MLIQQLIDKLSSFQWTDDLSISSVEVAASLTDQFIARHGRPIVEVPTPNYCDTTGFMAECKMGGKAEDQKACFYHEKHSYIQSCRYCVNVGMHHCDNHKAQMNRSSVVNTARTCSNEEMKKAWEGIILQKRLNALSKTRIETGIPH